MLELIKQPMKKALWPVLRKPWETEDMEFHYGLWNGVSALYSDSGRQLGEENTRPFALSHHIPAETIACKYAGSREGRQINISALRIAMQNFDAALAITQAVRRHHLRHLPDNHVLGTWDLYIIARASIALIAYQKRSLHQPRAQQTVSDPLTSQYQFISGVFMICRHMLERGDPAISGNHPMTAEALYAYADDHGIFVSFNGMACAGSTKKIRDFLEFCNTGPQAPSDLPFDLSEIVDQPSNWYQYALATIELDCYIEQERIVSEKSARSYADMGSYVRGLMEHFVQTEGASLDAGALIRQNAILKILGREPIGCIPDKHLRARLGVS